VNELLIKMIIMESVH